MEPIIQSGAAKTGSKTSFLALSGLVLVLLLVLGGALYLKGVIPGTYQEQAAVRAIETQSESTEPEAIEADLSSESPDEFDAEFDEAFAELDASLGE